MKIRTITTGISLSSLSEKNKIEQAATFNCKAKHIFEEAEYEVQTTRIATNSWQEYILNTSLQDVLSAIDDIEETCKRLDVGFLNIGYADTPQTIALLPDIIKNTATISCSAKIGDHETGISFENTQAAATAIKEISQKTDRGSGNFRFCAWANCPPGIPFFPTGYHAGAQTTFAIGLECGDLAMRAFSQSKNLSDAQEKLQELFEDELGKIAAIAERVAQETGITFEGIDASLAPSVHKDESIAFAYERLGLGKFGSFGTLAISAMITNVLKNLSVKTCGYSGLMLAVTEDYGLAERANEGAYSITNLLAYSAVCGCGLDTVPIPGDVSVKTIKALLLDVASLAIKLNKPLSARLFPVPDKKAGEMTNFNSPYLVDCKIFKTS